jgi:thiamine biosynthesis lipoprotein
MVVPLNDAALATSGNYRNYRVEDGKRISHILNPRTGYPEMNSLSSVSVLAVDAITADAYATAFMVMGLEQAMQFVEAREQLKAYFIARDEAGNLIEKHSSGFPAPFRQY